VGADHADAGPPMPASLLARPSVRYFKFTTATRQISLRNTGVNTLWLSFDRTNWFDVACGTSWDDRVNAKGFWYRTQVGVTSFVVNALALNTLKADIPEPTQDEMQP
jgi:hypothetical protein